jgi:exonuclease I
MAIRERRVSEGVASCKRAIALASSEPEMHLNLARLYSSTGQHQNAVETLRRAIRGGVDNKDVMAEIQRLSPRSTPPLPALHRDHFLNDILGRLRARLFGKRGNRSRPKATGRAPSQTPRVVRQRS